jgi:hypothetical protein
MATTCTILFLPVEIHVQILKYLSQEARLRLTTLCRAFRVAGCDGRLWKEVQIKPEFQSISSQNQNSTLTIIQRQSGWVSDNLIKSPPPVLEKLSSKDVLNIFLGLVKVFFLYM